MRDEELWLRLEGYSFNAIGAGRPFPETLALGTKWGRKFTLRAIEEYRRFLYLSQVCGRDIRSPAAIESAWRLHLIYPRDYWDGLCDGILGHPLHHRPRAQEKVTPQIEEQFEELCLLYEQEFGEEAPCDIWQLEESGSVAMIGGAMALFGLMAGQWEPVAGLGLVLLGSILFVAAKPAVEPTWFFWFGEEECDSGDCGACCFGGGE